MRYRFTSGSEFSSDSNETCSKDYCGVSFDISTQKKIRDLEQRIMRITSARQAFLEKHYTAIRIVEDAVRNITFGIQARKQELKSHLEEIGRAKNLEWNRQLQLCKEAGKSLKKIDEGFYEGVKTAQDACNALAEKIGFVDAGEVEFEVDDADVLKELKNLGVIFCGNEKVTDGNFGPKLAITSKGKKQLGISQPLGGLHRWRRTYFSRRSRQRQD